MHDDTNTDRVWTADDIRAIHVGERTYIRQSDGYYHLVAGPDRMATRGLATWRAVFRWVRELLRRWA